MSDYLRRSVSILLLICLFGAVSALPVCASEVTRPAVTDSAYGEMVEPDENRLGVSGGPEEDTESGRSGLLNGNRRNGASDETPDGDLADRAPDGLPDGEYRADEDGMVAGAAEENTGMSNWIVWGIVIALLIAAAIVAGVVFLVPSKDED